MRKRSKAREYALQALYQADIRKLGARDVLLEFWNEQPAPEDIASFATLLVNGTIKHLAEIDTLIGHHADNWDMKRMAVVDRNILRLGAYELLHVDDIPPSVSINEAIELAKRFGDSESAKFINGILDAIHKASPSSKKKAAADHRPHPANGATEPRPESAAADDDNDDEKKEDA